MSALSHQSKAVTLLELIISIVLLSVIILGLGSVNLFSHFHMIAADRASVVQNEVSFVLSHMQVRVAQASGMFNNQAVRAWDPPAGRGIMMRIDAAGTPRDYNDDTWVGYQQNAGTNTITFCNRIIVGPWPWACPAGNREVLTTRILTPALGGFNYVLLPGGEGVNITLTGRWDAAAGNAVDLRNPIVIERTELRSHSASAN